MLVEQSQGNQKTPIPKRLDHYSRALYIVYSFQQKKRIFFYLFYYFDGGFLWRLKEERGENKKRNGWRAVGTRDSSAYHHIEGEEVQKREVNETTKV